jgi:hypothetical protein
MLVIDSLKDYLKIELKASDIEIKEALNSAVFEDVDGNKDSAYSAILLDKYKDIDTYKYIARTALVLYREKVEKRNK